MKFVPPITHQLSLAEDQIKALEKENHKLRTELSRLTGQKTRISKARISSFINHKRPSKSEQSLPSYARSTTTSRLRCCPSTASSSRSTPPNTDESSDPPTPPKRVSVNGTHCAYKDGKLDVVRDPAGDSWSNGHIGYLAPTAASRSRERISSLTRIRLHNTSHISQTTPEKSGRDYSTEESYDADCSDEADEVDQPQPANTLPTVSQKGWDDIITQSGIAIRTRMADASWSRGWAYTVYIDHDALFDILSQTEALAKRCLWGWMRTHRPDECRRWSGYRSNIDFGRESLERFLDNLPGNFFNFRHTEHRQVHHSLRDLIWLRNFVHHFNGACRNVCQMDNYIENVQKLAVFLYDEEAAICARELRDKLRREAERTISEVETFMMLASLPVPEAGQPWKSHHTDLIQSARFDLGWGSPTGSYPPIVYTAARELDFGSRGFGVSA